MSMTVNMDQMKRVAMSVCKAGYPLLIRGRHGIGKSEFVYQFAKEAPKLLGASNMEEFEVIERRASLMTEGDLTGLPYRGPEINGQTSTKFNPPDWFLTACEKPVILFFDEVDRGIPEVRQGIFQINDSRQLNGHKLHPLTRVIACINGGIHGSKYQVGDFDPAELDRYTVYDLEPDVEEWASYCRAVGIMPEIINFCLENQKFLEYIDTSAHDPTQVTPSRRSWVRLSRTLQEMEEFKDGFNEENVVFMTIIACGFVGLEAASAFRVFAQEFKRTVTPEQVVFHNNVEALDKMTVSDFAEFASNFVASAILNRDDLTEKNYSNIRQIFMKMPTEAIVILWQGVCVSGAFRPENIQKLGWDLENKATEAEQVAFTKAIADKIIDPPDNKEDIQDTIKKVSEEYENSQKESQNG